MGGTAFNSASYFHQSDLLPNRVRQRERPSKKRSKPLGSGRVWLRYCNCTYCRPSDNGSRTWKALLSMPYSRKFPEEEPWGCWSSTRGSSSAERGMPWATDCDEEDMKNEFFSRASTPLTIDLMDMARPRKRPQKGPRVSDRIPIIPHSETSDSDVFSWDDGFSMESDSESTWEVVE